LAAIGVEKRRLSWTRVGVLKKRLARQVEEEVTWYFAFYKSGRISLPLWMEFCMRGQYTHVLAFAQSGNVVTVLDPIHSHINVGIRRHPAGWEHVMPVDFIALDFALFGGDVVKITRNVMKAHTSHDATNYFPGCVTMAKGLLGLSDWIFTPWQFYQWLLENGGVEYTQDVMDRALDELVGRELTPAEREEHYEQMRRGRSPMGKKDDAAKEQSKRMREQEQKAAAEANKLKAENKRKSDAERRRRMGMSSLIKTSGLGVTDELG
jgi:hypothetical protein